MLKECYNTAGNLYRILYMHVMHLHGKLHVLVCLLCSLYMYIHLQLCCIVIAACTTEFIYGRTYVDNAATRICYEHPKVKHGDARICHGLMAGAISSILVAMFLMNFDVFIPCMGKMVITIIIICVYTYMHAYCK